MHHGASPLTPQVREALAFVMNKKYWPQDVITWCCVGWLSAECEVTAAGLTGFSSRPCVTHP